MIPYFVGGNAALRIHLNKLVDAVNGLYLSRGGPGINVTASPRGLQMQLVLSDRERWVQAKITAAPPPGVAIAPSLCKYSVKALDRHAAIMTDVLPTYGREVEGDECDVYPDKVGNLCFIGRNPQSDGTAKAELFVLAERVARGPC